MITTPKCAICSRPLADAESIKLGIGPVCLARLKRVGGSVTEPMLLDPPFPSSGLVCRCVEGEMRCNVPHPYKHYSPAGFGFGYDGSGPADLALNVLAILRPGRDVKLTDGTRISQLAWVLHQALKREFIGSMAKAGGEVPLAAIQQWIEEKTVGVQLPPDNL